MELSKELNELLLKSKTKEFVSEDEVSKYFDIESDDYEELIRYFKDNGVDIIPSNEMVELTDEDTMDPELKDLEDIEIDYTSFDTILSSVRIDDPVRMYLKDIGNIPLLDSNEEMKLAITVSNGRDALEKIKQFEDGQIDLSIEEEDKYRKLVDKAIFAKNKLVDSNLRLVVSIAKRYTGRNLQFLDLIQEGNIGLMKAVDKFEYERGFKFSTYATWWIKQAITRAVADQARTIRIPVHMVETINKLMRVQRQLVQDLSREPSIEEIADKMGISPDKVQTIIKIAQEPISLEKPVGEEDDSSLADFIADTNSPNPEEEAIRQMMKKLINDVLEEFTERERRVIKLRFGLEDGKSHTLEEVGNEFGVTRERIRQIETKTLNKLKKKKDINKLRAFIGKDDE